jgi:ribose transport system permease protein
MSTRGLTSSAGSTGASDETSGDTEGAGDKENSTSANPSSGGRLRGIAAKYAVVIVLLLLVVVFSALRPSTFFTAANAQAILANQAVLVVLALGLTVALAAGEFDLSGAAVVGFSASVLAHLTSVNDWPVGLAILVVLAMSALVGIVNGLFVVKFRVNSFITTLGSGTLVTGIAVGITGPTTIGNIPESLTGPGQTAIFGVSLLVYFAFLVAAILWFVLEHTVWGRHTLFTGMSPEAARLAGIPVSRVRWLSLVASSTLAGASGMLLLSQVGAADPTYGSAFLLPAFAAAFLGATTIKRGRYNAWGTVVGVYLLAIGTTGLIMLGASNWVSDVFNGGALMLAVAFAVLASRKTER